MMREFIGWEPQEVYLGRYRKVDSKKSVKITQIECGMRHNIVLTEDGKVYGKVSKILTVGEENKVCSECKGDLKNEPITGMVILQNLSKDGDEWNGGTILDPNNGKTYKCYITLESVKKLKVRGYIGFSLIGRTQYWYKVD